MLRVHANTVTSDKALLDRAYAEIAKLKSLLRNALEKIERRGGSELSEMMAENKALREKILILENTKEGSNLMFRSSNTDLGRSYAGSVAETDMDMSSSPFLPGIGSHSKSQRQSQRSEFDSTLQRSLSHREPLQRDIDQAKSENLGRNVVDEEPYDDDFEEDDEIRRRSNKSRNACSSRFREEKVADDINFKQAQFKQFSQDNEIKKQNDKINGSKLKTSKMKQRRKGAVLNLPLVNSSKTGPSSHGMEGMDVSNVQQLKKKLDS